MRRRSVLALAGRCALAQQVAGDGSNTHALPVQRGASTLADACFTGRTLAFSGLRLRPHRNPRARSRSSSVLRAPRVSFNSIWQLAIAKAASGARAWLGALASKLLKLPMASL